MKQHEVMTTGIALGTLMFTAHQRRGGTDYDLKN